MGGIHSCTKHVVTACADDVNTTNVDHHGGEVQGQGQETDKVSKKTSDHNALSWSLICFSRSSKTKTRSGNKTKNKNSKTGNIPARHQSCRDVLITAGQCERCGDRHLLGNLLQPNPCSHALQKEGKEGKGERYHADQFQVKRPKSISPCPNRTDRGVSTPRGMTGSVDNQMYATNSSCPAQKSNESRPPRNDGKSDVRIQKKTDRKERKKKDLHKAKQNAASGMTQAENGDDESNQIGMPEIVVDVPSGIRHCRECLEGSTNGSCVLQRMPSGIQDRKSSQAPSTAFDIRTYDTDKRDRNVAYILGNNPDEVLNPEGIGGYAFTDQFILQSCAPTVDLVCLDESLNIYACDLGLSADECNSIVYASEKCARIAGRYSAYTYAKQTLGCRDYDDLALECVVPTHVACQTIRQTLGLPPKEASNRVSKATGGTSNQKADKVQCSDVADDTTTIPQSPDATTVIVSPTPNATIINKSSTNIDDDNYIDRTRALQQESAPVRAVSDLRPSIMVLDEREPHVVKYDTVDKTRQRLEMHTDKSEWTFLIALSEYGTDYEGGGTFFEDSRTTYHLRRGTCLIFPGRLKHCGRKICKGSRFLLVGFLVEKKQESVPEEGTVQASSPLATRSANAEVPLEPSSYDECDELLSDEESQCCD